MFQYFMNKSNISVKFNFQSQSNDIQAADLDPYIFEALSTHFRDIQGALPHSQV